MHKIRHALQLIAITVCLIWGGYQASSPVFAYIVDGEDSAATEMAAAKTTAAQSDEELAQLYPGLPAPVARAVNSVVATQQIVDTPDAQARAQGLVASGVIVSDSQVLAAAHNVLDDDGTIACSRMNVVAAGLLSGASATNDSVTHASARYNHKADIAVLEVSSSENFRSLPDMSLVSARPKQGEVVYFINFQPTADGKLRSPTDPAIFSGTVVYVTARDIVVAAGGGASFGRGVPDTMLRKGASGGAVVNAQGELIGLSIASDSLRRNRTATSLERDYGVRLAADRKYQIAHVQPVAEGVVNNLQAGMISCSEYPG